MTNGTIKTAIITLCLLAGLSVIAAGTPTLKQVIQKYKAGNYTGCVQDAEEITKKDPSNAAVYYYMGSAYMKIGMKDAAKQAFGKVADLSTAPQLVSLSLQAIHCIDTNVAKCTYLKLSQAQINELKANPADFYTNLNSGNKNDNPEGDPDVEALINGKYANGIHPDAQNKINEMKNPNLRLKMLQESEEINNEKSQPKQLNKHKKIKSENNVTGGTEKISDNKKPSDKEVANALLTLAKAGYTLNAPEEAKASGNTDENKTENNNKDITKEIMKAYTENLMTEQALMGGFYGNNNGNSGMNMLPMLLLMQQQQNNGENSSKNKLSPELVRTMMMSQMQQGLFDFDNNSKF